MDRVIKVVHFHNGSGGGVLSVIRNLLFYKQNSNIENHVIYTINKDQLGHYEKPGLEGAVNEQIFYYSPKWNFYYTCRQLAKLLPDDEAIIVAHDWLELGMVSNLGLPNPVVQFVHGAYDYYYSLAAKHSQWIDNYITVAQSIKDELVLRLPNRKGAIQYLRFPVPDVKSDINQKMYGFHIVFVGRCEEAKGYYLLPEIDKELIRRGVKVQWHIAGGGSESQTIKAVWPINSEIKFHGNMANAELIQLLCTSHALILPSKAEGMPISVVEAMQAGAIPIVNNLPGGLNEIIINGVTGYRIKENKLEYYVDIIQKLYYSDELIKSLSHAAKSHINGLFDPWINTNLIEKVIIEKNRTKIKHSRKLYGSRLDNSYLPNFITFALRKTLHR